MLGIQHPTEVKFLLTACIRRVFVCGIIIQKCDGLESQLLEEEIVSTFHSDLFVDLGYAKRTIPSRAGSRHSTPLNKH